MIVHWSWSWSWSFPWPTYGEHGLCAICLLPSPIADGYEMEEQIKVSNGRTTRRTISGGGEGDELNYGLFLAREIPFISSIPFINEVGGPIRGNTYINTQEYMWIRFQLLLEQWIPIDNWRHGFSMLCGFHCDTWIIDSLTSNEINLILQT